MGTGLGTENKIMGYLTNKKIDSVNDKGVYIDGDGLRLRVDNKSNKNWVFRYHIFGQSKDMGLGKYPVVSLKDARILPDALLPSSTSLISFFII